MADTLKFKQVEVDEFGNVFVEWVKADGTRHRGSCCPGQDAGGYMAAVRDHVVEMGFEPILDTHAALFKTVASAVWTPENIAAATAEVVAATQAQREALAAYEIATAQAKAAADALEAEKARLAEIP